MAKPKTDRNINAAIRAIAADEARSARAVPASPASGDRRKVNGKQDFDRQHGGEATTDGKAVRVQIDQLTGERDFERRWRLTEHDHRTIAETRVAFLEGLLQSIGILAAAEQPHAPDNEIPF